jgi:hypothetical protein
MPRVTYGNFDRNETVFRFPSGNKEIACAAILLVMSVGPKPLSIIGLTD